LAAFNENTFFAVLFTFQESPPEADKPMTPHFLRYQDLEVDDHSCGLGPAVSSFFVTLGLTGSQNLLERIWPKRI